MGKKDKFALLKDEDSQEVVDNAALKENKNDKSNETVKYQQELPKDLSDNLMDRKKIESRVSFVRRAAIKLAKEEGIL